MAGRRPCPRLSGSTLHDDYGLTQVRSGEGLLKTNTVDHAFDVAQHHAGGIVSREPFQIVGDIDRSRVARRHRTCNTNATGACQVHETRNEIATLARDRNTAAWRIRGNDLRTQRARRTHHALAVGARNQHAKFSAERYESSLRGLTGFVGFAIASRRNERSSNTPACARTQNVFVGRCWRTEHCQIKVIRRQIVDGLDTLHTEHGLT